MNDKELSIFDHCKYCEHTKDECQKCYPELGYKNTKMERDTKATEEFIKNFTNEEQGINTTKILLDNSKTPEEKVYLIAKAIRDSGRSIDDDLWYAILDLKDKNFPTMGNDIDYFAKRKE